MGMVAMIRDALVAELYCSPIVSKLKYSPGWKIATMRRGLTAFQVRAGKPVLMSRKTKKTEAPRKRKNISAKGGKHCRAIFVATKDSPQKRTAIIRAT